MMILSAEASPVPEGDKLGRANRYLHYKSIVCFAVLLYLGNSTIIVNTTRAIYVFPFNISYKCCTLADDPEVVSSIWSFYVSANYNNHWAV